MGRTTDRPVSLVSPHGKTREDTIRNDRRQSFNPKVGGSIPPGPTRCFNPKVGGSIPPGPTDEPPGQGRNLLGMATHVMRQES